MDQPGVADKYQMELIKKGFYMIDVTKLKLGDIIVHDCPNEVNHYMIYIGDGKVAHSQLDSSYHSLIITDLQNELKDVDASEREKMFVVSHKNEEIRENIGQQAKKWASAYEGKIPYDFRGLRYFQVYPEKDSGTIYDKFLKLLNYAVRKDQAPTNLGRIETQSGENKPKGMTCWQFVSACIATACIKDIKYATYEGQYSWKYGKDPESIFRSSIAESGKKLGLSSRNKDKRVVKKRGAIDSRFSSQFKPYYPKWKPNGSVGEVDKTSPLDALGESWKNLTDADFEARIKSMLPKILLKYNFKNYDPQEILKSFSEDPDSWSPKQEIEFKASEPRKVNSRTQMLEIIDYFNKKGIKDTQGKIKFGPIIDFLFNHKEDFFQTLKSIKDNRLLDLRLGVDEIEKHILEKYSKQIIDKCVKEGHTEIVELLRRDGANVPAGPTATGAGKIMEQAKKQVQELCKIGLSFSPNKSQSAVQNIRHRKRHRKHCISCITSAINHLEKMPSEYRGDGIKDMLTLLTKTKALYDKRKWDQAKKSLESLLDTMKHLNNDLSDASKVGSNPHGEAGAGAGAKKDMTQVRKALVRNKMNWSHRFYKVCNRRDSVPQDQNRFRL